MQCRERVLGKRVLGAAKSSAVGGGVGGGGGGSANVSPCLVSVFQNLRSQEDTYANRWRISTNVVFVARDFTTGRSEITMGIPGDTLS